MVSGCLAQTAHFMEVLREITNGERREEDQAMPCSITKQRSPFLVLQMRRDEGREAGTERSLSVQMNGCSDNQMERGGGKIDR